MLHKEKVSAIWNQSDARTTVLRIWNTYHFCRCHRQCPWLCVLGLALSANPRSAALSGSVTTNVEHHTREIFTIKILSATWSFFVLMRIWRNCLLGHPVLHDPFLFSCVSGGIVFFDSHWNRYEFLKASCTITLASLQFVIMVHTQERLHLAFCSPLRN